MIRLSSIGHLCDRYLWLKHNKYSTPPYTDKQLRIFNFGHAIEEIIVKELKRDHHVSDEQKKVLVDTEITGHIDGIIYGHTLLEIKSANSTRFRSMKSELPSTYEAQVQCYMHGLGLSQCLFIIINKDTAVRHDVDIEYDEQAALMFINRGKEILNTKEMPKKTKTYNCKFCGYSLACINDDFETGMYSETF